MMNSMTSPCDNGHHDCHNYHETYHHETCDTCTPACDTCHTPCDTCHHDCDCCCPPLVNKITHKWKHKPDIIKVFFLEYFPHYFFMYFILFFSEKIERIITFLPFLKVGENFIKSLRTDFYLRINTDKY